jgi:Lar family restriction alleviation protein
MGKVTTVGGLEMFAVMRKVRLYQPDDISLKPCPFCGKEGALHRESQQGHDRYIYSAECSNTSCGVRTPVHYRTEEDAAAAWNRRAGSASHVQPR